jgi:hypothetical protein
MNDSTKNSFTVFSDESHITASRYRSISSISLPSNFVVDFSNLYIQLLKESSIKEFKYHKLDSARYRFMAIKIVDLILNNLERYKIRVDTIVWDTQDNRHMVKNRDDIGNLGRMYYHLLKFIMHSRGPETIWNIYPDEHVSIDWYNLKECLANVGKWVNVFKLPAFNIIETKENFSIAEFEQRISIQTPLIQVADLFAGISVFSNLFYMKFKDWAKQQSGQIDLFQETGLIQLSQGEMEKIKLLDYLIKKLNKRKLGVSIDTKKRLWTPVPKNPINFWLYEPQNPNDKAPTKDDFNFSFD